ncbi:type I methionyl aminopeptidase [Candidatus Gottesmanbacteria bacterium RIFCSPHIGHO2_02_FULL_40_24]|uniref:Methionine aminopeptidase n=1 Tax=Candidatus Gottesmanbacteria bacterium RIFCSPHIGHO2_01_FULL_40_15 TaxID=1798376 RepID=A0A1F5Z6L7_9BACT|nr:MAG: type I methionyl aminopeptidase [Candidatus Gottesmanbacteria bacterium RIFCSPHIGHO2_01_FULL_40_15]OGG18233.1 MAG: type I methionyl aminopeptidase [Candidatus Gottesmanbacteria bacterium RIFCSPHIGHO2_02_FULL_40_24]OGG22899.1 MAG: type I methionyl aminopeptidase [Candidatus Gottesmanbacteria bacterium RIFCSPLOWO2_01_FULL_40_10]OGG23517.1 MAG: type I methionyl aminopeptidase [Candidatus Gottesmanbacteria bacterium RIFCSPHIGHO2_12_FULL_40_13]OGG32483.1 MAG: type I methionyl aminopeptidase 
MTGIELKSDKEIKIMQEGGMILNNVMTKMLSSLKIGVSMLELDNLAETEITKSGADPSFKMVPGYKWTICACVNDIVVHGIPNSYKARPGDIIGIDCGVFYRGFHTDSSWSVYLKNPSEKNAKEKENFLQIGRQALNNSLDQVKEGNYIYDISEAIQNTVESGGFNVVKSLIGHGIGRKLHEEPEIPCYVSRPRLETPEIVPGNVFAVEVIYNMGTSEVVIKRGDGWTIQTKDGKMSGLFEATVAISSHGIILLTKKYDS